MTKLFLIITFLVTTLGNVRADDSKPLTLIECYQLALKRSEVLASKEALVKEAEGQFLQSLSTALPQLSYRYDIDYQQDRHRQESGRFTLSQPLFTGFKEFAAIRGSKSLKSQRQQDVIRAKQLLFIDVADAYYLLAYYINDLQAVVDILISLKQQEDEIIKRVNLGRARASERAAIEAKRLNQEAALIEAKTNQIVAQDLLAFLIGRPVKELDVNKRPLESTRDLADYEALSAKRSDVLSAQYAFEVAQKKVTVAKAGFWPTVSLDGNYYTRHTPSTPHDWDALLKFEMPLFQGGSNVGDMKVAQAQATQASLVLSETERRALLETRQAYAKWQGAATRSEAFDKAYAASMKSYQMQEEDYANRLISILDFLQASNELLNARREQNLAHTEASRWWWQLKVKAGDLDDVNF